MSLSSTSVIDRGSTSLESHLRTRPLVFSTVPFCQGDCGSQNLRSDASLQIGPFAELGASVEGDGAPSSVGQRLEHLDQPVHDRLRLPVVVAQKDSKAADPLDQ